MEEQNLKNKYSKFNRTRRRKFKRSFKLCLKVVSTGLVFCLLILVTKTQLVNAINNNTSLKEDSFEELLIEYKDEIVENNNPPKTIFLDPEEDGYYWEKKFSEELESETLDDNKNPLPITFEDDGTVECTLIDENILDFSSSFEPDSASSDISWSEEDEKYLIMLLTGECQNRSYEVQLIYGSVCLNRVNSKHFPNTIKEVCLQGNGSQYACFKTNGTAYREPTQTSIDAARYLLENGSQIPDNVVYQAQFKQGSGLWKEIQGEYFCYL